MFEEKEQENCYSILRSEDRAWKGKVGKAEKHEKWSEEGWAWRSWSRYEEPAWLVTEGMGVGGEVMWVLTVLMRGSSQKMRALACLIYPSLTKDCVIW